MRTTLLLASALALVACGHSDRPGAPAVTDTSLVSSMHGPDQLVLRLPRDGGNVRAFAYPNLDSLVWTSRETVPRIDRVLAFDYDAGSVAAVDSRGAPVRVDLRLGSVTRETSVKLDHLTSTDGSAIYGIDVKGRVVRLTPSGDWKFTPPSPARDVFPEPDGALLVMADTGHSTTIWQVRPPESSIVDTVVVPEAGEAVLTPIGDRLYLVQGSSLTGVQTRGLNVAPRVELDASVRDVAITPSGDRIYVAPDSSRQLVVIDRYTHRVTARIALPGQAVALRMDPTGRYVLARAAHGDSAWVVGIATDRVIGAVESSWRDDLPAVAPDGKIALVDGKNVVLVDGQTLAPLQTIRGAGRDIWQFVAWDGFRPRTQGPDEPALFESDTNLHPDISHLDSAVITSVPRADTPAASPDTQPMRADSAPRRAPTFTVQFAAVRSAQSAQDVAHELLAAGSQPRVVPSTVAGVTIYRVILGPFTTRAAADSAGLASGKPYWIYEGAP